MLETLNRIGELDKKLDVMVVDHYEIDHHWESIMAKSVHYLVVIDDLANRKHYCHFLLDPNFHRNPEDRYRGLVPPFSKLLLGPKYSLLRDEFRFNRTNTKVRGDRLRRILVSMGGTDPDNVTMKVIRALKLLNLEDIFVDVVVGSSNPNKTEIKQAIADEPHFFYHEQVQNMAELMKRADLAVGAGGSTSWERCCMGLPTLVINIAENQQDISESLACVGAIVNLGDAENITVEKIAQSITSYFENPVRLKKMSEIGMNLVDGMGAQRVAEEVQIYKYKSTIVSDANSWMNDYIPSFIPYLQKQGHFVTWVHEVSDIEAGDFAFYLGCGQITPESILQRNRHNLVVHGSALPQGKGWSPLTWQILEGKMKFR